MSYRIFLVRHGESTANVDRSVYTRLPDHAIPLTDRGRMQAREAGDILHNHIHGEAAKVFTSPYLRAVQTAEEAISRGLWSYPIRQDILLAEQQFGLFDGLSDDELTRQYPAEHAHYQKCEQHNGRFWARMPLGESRFDVACRVRQMFGTLQRDMANCNTFVIVAHGVTIRAFVMQWLHLSVEWFEKERNPENGAVRLIEDGRDCGYLVK